MRIALKLDPQIRQNGTQTVLFTVSDGKSGTPHHIRKKISTSVSVNKSKMEKNNFRVKNGAKNQVALNIALKDLKDRRDTALINYESGQWRLNQVIFYLKGEVAYDSVDSYIETVLKKSKSPATYNDYKYTLKAFKKHLKRNDLISFNEFSNYTILDTFKRNAIYNGLSNSSINSYFIKIRAILNDAYDNGIIQKKFVLNKKLRLAVRPKPPQTCTPDDFRKAIKKVKNIYDWQSLAFFLLMFCTRGMYPADIVKFKLINFESAKNDVNSFIKDVIISRGYDYLVHRRSKTSNRGNEDMYIRIDGYPTFALIVLIKKSIVYTHSNTRPQIIPSLNDTLAIFDYDVDKDYELHKNIWDNYIKRITKLLGYSFNKARKTFNTYALELEVSDTIRRVLLGHADESMLSHYDNTQTDAMRKQVEDAHLSVLERFEASLLLNDLFVKLERLDVPKWLYSGSHWQEFGKTYRKRKKVN